MTRLQARIAHDSDHRNVLLIDTANIPQDYYWYVLQFTFLIVISLWYVWNSLPDDVSFGPFYRFRCSIKRINLSSYLRC